MCFLMEVKLRNLAFRATKITFSGLVGRDDSHAESFVGWVKGEVKVCCDVKWVGKSVVIDCSGECVACAVDGIGKFLAFVTRGVGGGNLVESVLCMEVKSETVLTTWRLSPPLHFTRYLPGLCHTYLNPIFLAEFLRDRKSKKCGLERTSFTKLCNRQGTCSFRVEEG